MRGETLPGAGVSIQAKTTADLAEPRKKKVQDGSEHWNEWLCCTSTLPKRASPLKIEVFERAETRLMSERIPIACNVRAIEEVGGVEASGRHEEVSNRLLTRVIRAEEQEDGLSLLFEADVDTLILAGEFVARERLCCPFLHFRLDIEPDADNFRLILSGDAEAKALLEAELLSKIRG